MRSSGRWCARRWMILLALVGALQAGGAAAIDNPDRPDPVREFTAQADAFEARIRAAEMDKDILDAYVRYEAFLDQAMNDAYGALRAFEKEAQRQDLLRSQRQWLAFRNAELRYIANTWTSADFGSSAAVSRAAYRAALLRARVETLLGYLRSYPPR